MKRKCDVPAWYWVLSNMSSFWNLTTLWKGLDVRPIFEKWGNWDAEREDAVLVSEPSISYPFKTRSSSPKPTFLQPPDYHVPRGSFLISLPGWNKSSHYEPSPSPVLHQPFMALIEVVTTHLFVGLFWLRTVYPSLESKHRGQDPSLTLLIIELLVTELCLAQNFSGNKVPWISERFFFNK